MRKIAIISTIGAASVVAGLASLQLAGAQTLVTATEDLECTFAAQTEYLLQSPDVAPVSASPSRAFMGAERQDILEVLGALELPDKTSFVVSHEPSMEIFVQTCAEQKCTIEEFFAPEQACQREHISGCVFAAVKYEKQTYCLLSEIE